MAQAQPKQQMAQPPVTLLHSASSVNGTWPAENCSCSNAPIHVFSRGEDAFEAFSVGWMGLNCPCLGALPRRTFTRVPGTNRFVSQSAEAEVHTAILLSERQMQLDGLVYNWGEGSNV